MNTEFTRRSIFGFFAALLALLSGRVPGLQEAEAKPKRKKNPKNRKSPSKNSNKKKAPPRKRKSGTGRQAKPQANPKKKKGGNGKGRKRSGGKYRLVPEDGNQDRAGGGPRNRLIQWKNRKGIMPLLDISYAYMFRTKFWNSMPRDYRRDYLIPKLKESDTKLIFDGTGGTWPCAGRQNIAIGEMEMFKEAAEDGLAPWAVLTQSMLSKNSDHICPRLTMAERMQGGWEYFDLVLTEFPKAKVGIICAAVVQNMNWRHLYRFFRDFLEKRGIKRGQIIIWFDVPVQKANWAKIRKATQYVRSLGMEVGILLTSMEDKNAKQWHNDVLQGYKAMKKARVPANYIGVGSWKSVPKATSPVAGAGYTLGRTCMTMFKKIGGIRRN